MSYIIKMFGSSSKKDEPTIGGAIAKLQNIEELLIKKQEFLERKIQMELDVVKANGTRNKRLSIPALKRKKRYEEQLRKLDGTLTTIELQREALENANTNTKVLETMKLASDVLKKSQKDLDLDKVHDILDDISEQQEVSAEITQAISSPIGGDLDEDDLEKELELLEQEELDKELMTVPEPCLLPSVPGSSLGPQPSAVRVPRDEDEDELKKLEKWAT